MKGFRAICPHCEEKLSDSDHIIGDMPAIQVKVRFGEEEGIIWISAKLGDLKIDSGDIDIPEEEVVVFFCPHCDTKISNGASGDCDACDAPMVRFIFEMEAEVCSRRGCDGHSIAKISGTTAGPTGTYFW